MAHGPHAALGLQQGGARERFLEKFQGLVIIQQLDGLGEGDELLRACCRPLLPLLLLRGAVLVQVLQEAPVVEKRLGSVVEILLERDDLQAQLPMTPGLRLNGCSVHLDLLGLCRAKLLEVLDGRLLRGRHLCQILFHSVLHLLENAGNLPAARRVFRRGACGEECGQHVPVRGAQIHVDRHLTKPGSRGGLEESGHALVERGDRLAQGRHVRLVLGRVLRINCRLLLSQSRGLRQRLLRVHPVLLVSLQLLLQLRLLRCGLLEAAGVLGDLRLGGRDGSGEVASAGLTVTHKTVEKLLFLLALGGDLLLHHLQHAHHTSDRVRRGTRFDVGPRDGLAGNRRKAAPCQRGSNNARCHGTQVRRTTLICLVAPGGAA
mmetsp:Transcript_74127/g.214733  ORF Transcript_74127/g.214733 Transcript_74127/m.214733 type:complete len:376 (-) Transcript_74127:7-1134(-)